MGIIMWTGDNWASEHIFPLTKKLEQNLLLEYNFKTIL